MNEYNISKKEKTVYTAKIHLENSKKIIQYDLESFGLGWQVKRWVWDASEGFPEVSDMFLPQEIVDLILAQSAKNKLTE